MSTPALISVVMSSKGFLALEAPSEKFVYQLIFHFVKFLLNVGNAAHVSLPRFSSSLFLGTNLTDEPRLA